MMPVIPLRNVCGAVGCVCRACKVKCRVGGECAAARDTCCLLAAEFIRMRGAITSASRLCCVAQGIRSAPRLLRSVVQGVAQLATMHCCAPQYTTPRCKNCELAPRPVAAPGCAAWLAKHAWWQLYDNALDEPLSPHNATHYCPQLCRVYGGGAACPTDDLSCAHSVATVQPRDDVCPKCDGV